MKSGTLSSVSCGSFSSVSLYFSGSFRYRIISFRFFTPITFISGIRLASFRFPFGTTQNLHFSSLALITIGRIPEIAWISPLRLNSPAIITPFRCSGFRISPAASTAAARGRSNPAPSFLISAGAKFTVILFGGRAIPLFFRAVLTLSWASFTWADGNPTMVKLGRPSLTSAST